MLMHLLVHRELPRGPGQIVHITEGGQVWLAILVSVGAIAALIWAFASTQGPSPF